MADRTDRALPLDLDNPVFGERVTRQGQTIPIQVVKVMLGGASVDAGDLSADNPLPVGASRGTLTDRSGTLTTGGVAQTIMSANTSRRYLLVQNVSDEDLWVNFGGAATNNQPSVKLIPDAVLVMEDSFISTELVSVYGATTGKAFAAKEA